MDKKTGMLYSNSYDCLKKIITKEGVRSLYNGFLINSVKFFLSSSLQIIILNEIKGKKQ